MSWPYVALGDIFDIARGGSPRPINEFITEDPEGINWIMISDATDSSKYISKTKKRIKTTGVSRSRLVHSGDFLLTNSMSFGRPYILKTSGCIHDGWLVLSPKRNDVDQDYFYHLLASDVVNSEFNRRAAGTTVKNLNIDIVKGVKVHLPPLSEQRRIAVILDKADAIRRKRQRALQLTEEFLQSVFMEMFRDPNIKLKKYRFSDLAYKKPNSFVNGPFGSNLLSSELQSEGIPVIYIRDIRDGEYKRVSTVCVTPQKAEELSYCKVDQGDVLIAKVGDPPGTAAVYPDGQPAGIVTQDVVRIKVEKKIVHPEFLVSYFNSPLGQHLIKPIIIEATRSRFPLGSLKKLEIHLPPIEDQLQFSEITREVHKFKEKQRIGLERTINFFSTLNYLSFHGELINHAAGEVFQEAVNA